MAIRSNYKRRTRALFKEIGTTQAERAVTEILVSGLAYANEYVPIDTSALINSKYRQTQVNSNSVKGVAGYYQSYAVYLHENTNWKPRPPNTRGKKGGGYNANARPKFLEEGFIDGEKGGDFMKILKRYMGL